MDNITVEEDILDGFLEHMEDCFQKAAVNDSVINTTLDALPSCSDSYYEYLPPLWQSDFVVAVIYCTLVGLAFCMGTFGNIIILIITITTRTVKKIGRDFFINLALADLCVSLVGQPMCILGVIKGEEWFMGQLVLCDIVASMCLTACLCSFLSLTLLAFNRYMYVCHYKIYHSIFSRPVCILLCILCWVFSFGFELPNFIGWGDHTFDRKNHQCIWDRAADFSYTVFLTAGLIGTPLFLIGLFFILIFRKIWKSKYDVFSLNLDDPLRMRRTWLEAARSSKTLFCVFLAFVICWTPYAVITAVDVSDEFSMEKHLFVTLLAHYHSGLNLIIFTATNKSFRGSVFGLFTCVSSLKYKSSMDTYSKSDTAKTTPTDTKVFTTSPLSSSVLPGPDVTQIDSDYSMKKCDSIEDILDTNHYDSKRSTDGSGHI